MVAIPVIIHLEAQVHQVLEVVIMTAFPMLTPMRFMSIMILLKTFKHLETKAVVVIIAQ